MCADGWDDSKDVNGVCPDCGEPTVDGDAGVGCNWSPIDCATCGAWRCDDSC